jgi:capsular polysaccharide biosynthesis protein
MPEQEPLTSATPVAPPAGRRRAPDRRTEAAALPLPSRSLTDELTRAVRAHWKLVALIAAAITLVAWLLAALQPKRYRTSSIAAVTPVAETLSTSEMIRGVETLDRRVIIASITALADAPATVKAAGAKPGDDVAAFVMPNTAVFRLEVEGTDPRHIADVANRVPPILGQQSRMMYKIYGVTTISPASVPEKAVLPRVERAVIAGLAFGLLVGVAAAWLISHRRFG